MPSHPQWNLSSAKTLTDHSSERGIVRTHLAYRSAAGRPRAAAGLRGSPPIAASDRLGLILQFAALSFQSSRAGCHMPAILILCQLPHALQTGGGLTTEQNPQPSWSTGHGLGRKSRQLHLAPRGACQPKPLGKFASRSCARQEVHGANLGERESLGCKRDMAGG